MESRGRLAACLGRVVMVQHPPDPHPDETAAGGRLAGGASGRRLRVALFVIGLLVYGVGRLHDLSFDIDELHYLEGARNLARGAGFTKNNGESLELFSPLYPLCVTPIYMVTGRILGSAFAASAAIAAGAIAVWIAFVYAWSGGAGGDRWFPALALFILFTNRFWTGALLRLGPEGLLLLALGAELLALTRLADGATGRRMRLVWAVVAGLGAAAAYVARPDGLVYSGLAAVWFLVRLRGLRRPFPAAAAAAGLIVAIVAASPYLLYLRAATGEWTLTAKTEKNLLHGVTYTEDRLAYEQIIYGGWEEEQEEPEARRRAERMAEEGLWGMLVHYPRELAGRVWVNTGEIVEALNNFIGLAWGWPLLALAALALACGPAAVRRGELAALGVFLPGLAILLPFHVEDRYVLVPAVLIAPPLLAAGVLWLVERGRRLREGRWKRRAVYVLALALYVGMAQETAPEDMFDKPDDEDRHYDQLAQWAREAGLAPGTVVSRKNKFNFRLNWPREALPYVTNHGDLLAFLDEVNARYLLIEEDQVLTKRPELGYLVRPTAETTAGLKLLRSLNNPGHEDSRLVLYSVDSWEPGEENGEE
ncbi:MAG TPA: hypothetical protein PK847_06100 [Candidatus Sumerlaeota bacterium]|nr:hypothetical protein [Candidatus Sumerlaeota bacterium]